MAAYKEGVKLTQYYEHTQVGYSIIAALIIALLISVYYLTTASFNWNPIIGLIILGACLATFSTLKVLINEDVLEISFGLGIIRKSLSLNDLESYQIVKNPWYYGWGIHLTPHGWLYNVSGFYAVEIKMKTGKRYIIGTDVPTELGKAIQQSIERITRPTFEG